MIQNLSLKQQVRDGGAIVGFYYPFAKNLLLALQTMFNAKTLFVEWPDSEEDSQYARNLSPVAVPIVGYLSEQVMFDCNSAYLTLGQAEKLISVAKSFLAIFEETPCS
jgi:hypothetical protein